MHQMIFVSKIAAKTPKFNTLMYRKKTLHEELLKKRV